MVAQDSLASFERWLGGFPAENARHTLDDLIEADDNSIGRFKQVADRVIERWKGDHFAGLYLWGNPGTGKTMAATVLARALHEQEFQPVISYTHLPTTDEDRQDVTRSCLTGDPSYWSLGSAIYRSNSKNIRKDINKDPYIPLVHVIDEFRPQQTKSLKVATEIAAQRGDLLIVTSNFTSPFEVIEAAQNTSPKDEQEIMLADLVSRIDSEGFDRVSADRKRQAEIEAGSLASRFASAIMPIEFTGPDMRMIRNFWTD